MAESHVLSGIVSMLGLGRLRDVPILETDHPWAFRPGDLFRYDQDVFEITRVARQSWAWFSRQKPCFVIYGTRCSPGTGQAS